MEEVTDQSTQTIQPTQQGAQQGAPQTAGARLVDTTIDNQNTALNVLVGFAGLAQRRGAFALDEAAKVFECIKAFQIPTQQ